MKRDLALVYRILDFAERFCRLNRISTINIDVTDPAQTDKPPLSAPTD